MLENVIVAYQVLIVRYVLSCSQNPDVIEKWEAGTGIVIKDGYGQSETVSETVCCSIYQ